MEKVSFKANTDPVFNQAANNQTPLQQSTLPPAALETKQDSYEKEGYTKEQKVGVVAAVAAAVAVGLTAVAASRGKKINDDSAGLFKNIKEGFKSIFTKEGREAYNEASERLAREADDLKGKKPKPKKETGDTGAKPDQKPLDDAGKDLEAQAAERKAKVAAEAAEREAKKENAKAYQAYMDEFHGINRPAKSAEESAQVFEAQAKKENAKAYQAYMDEFHGINRPAKSAEESFQVFEAQAKAQAVAQAAAENTPKQPKMSQSYAQRTKVRLNQIKNGVQKFASDMAAIIKK